MREAGISIDAIERIVWNNPVAFFAQSGRLTLEEKPPIDQRRLHEGNSVLRGQLPVVPPAAS
jgi:hypothetical protein